MPRIASVLALALAVTAQEQSIYEIASGIDDFSTLITAVDAAGLQETLSGPGTFTVFAPTNAAFAALPAGVLDSLLADPTGALKNVLLYHVLPVVVTSDQLTLNAEVATVEGSDVKVTSLDPPTINESEIIAPLDVPASNGVIHTINAVLIPPEATTAPSMMPTKKHKSDAAGTVSAGIVSAAAAATLAAFAL